jgi:superfamily II DNA or RNA helicase
MNEESLYPHQKRTIKKAWALSEAGKNVLISSPGGSGKTYMDVGLAARALRAGRTSLMLVHRELLMNQTLEHLTAYGIPRERIGIVGFGRNQLPDYMAVCVAGVQAYSRRDLERADHVFIAETHHAAARTYQDIVASHPHGRVCGSTATPVRYDGIGFASTFDTLLVGATYKELLRKGLVVAPTCYGAGGVLVDLSNVPHAAGDYDQEALARVMDREELAGDTLKDYKKRAGGQRAFGFAVSVLHAKHLAAKFTAGGVVSEHIHGGMTAAEQKEIVSRFRSGKTRVLWSCDLMNEGVDIPAVRVVIMARPTLSYVVYQQQCSRCQRRGSPAKILDHAGNVLRHGYPYVDRDFSLSGTLLPLPETSEVKECPDCHELVLCGETVCPGCGYAFPSPARRLILPENGASLVELGYREQSARVRAFAKKKGLPASWADAYLQKYKERLQAVLI